MEKFKFLGGEKISNNPIIDTENVSIYKKICT